MTATLTGTRPLTDRTREQLRRAGNPFRNYFARNPDDDVCARYHVAELFAAALDVVHIKEIRHVEQAGSQGADGRLARARVRRHRPCSLDNRSLAELAAEQGIAGPQDTDALFGAGADLWDDDADFETFLAGLRESRRTGG